jgi:hypothetical protein
MSARFTLLLSFVLLSGCSNTARVQVPPRMELKAYGTFGIVQFASSDPAVAALATRQFQEAVQAAQPGTRFVELGAQPALGAADARKLAAKHGVDAIFTGELIYGEPKADVRISDAMTLSGSVRAELRGDISARLLEAASGASVWSSSAWAKRQLGGVRVSADQGVSAAVTPSDPRREMIPALVFHLTQDFRPSYQAISAARR